MSATDDGWPPGRFNKARARYIWLWAAVWLVYLVEPVRVAWHHPEPWRRVVGVTVTVLFSALYLVGFVRLRNSFRVRYRRLGRAENVVILGSMLGLAVLMAATVGESAIGTTVYIAVMTVFLFPTRVAWSLVAGYVALIVVI